jgi:prepilin-type N-terminal cleavage/methylation domain-containing protein
VQSGAVQQRAVSLLNSGTWDVTITSAGGLEPTMGGATLSAMGRASSHFTSRHPARTSVARCASAEGERQVTRPAACHAANMEEAWNDAWERRLGSLASPRDLPMTADQPRPVSALAQHPAGFTLLEVVIAIGILGTILVILFGTYTAVAERAARTRDISQIYHEARVLLRVMADDVRSAYVKTATTQAQLTAQQAPQGGLSVKVPLPTFVGEHRMDENQPANTLAFATILPVQRPDVPDTEMCRVAYSLEPVINHPESLMWVRSASQNLDPATSPSQPRGLFRRVNCSIDPTVTTEDHIVLLTDAARGLEFKYYDAQGTEYIDWNSQQPRGGASLPAWIKITLLLVDRHGQLRPFTLLTDLVFSHDSSSSTAGTSSTESGTLGGVGSGTTGTGGTGSGTRGGIGSGTTGTGGTGSGTRGGVGSGTTGTGSTGSRR